jgi:hypothetical protein
MMPDLHLPEDEAALYVVGELTAAERARFEARLAQSADLRALVRELEEGAVVLAMATPRRQPPSFVWQGIEKAVAEERGKVIVPAFWSAWWRNGWSAAAACLVGWLIYALWASRPAPSDISPQTASSEPHSQPGPTLADSSWTEKTSLTPPPSAMATTTTEQLLQAKMRENDALRQVLELKNQVSHLSESVAQQEALLTEPNRLKFFQLRPASDVSEDPAPVQLSPALQRAISLAMAREVGWAPSANPADQLDVDFVDFRPSTDGTPNSLQVKPKDQTKVAAGSGSSSPPNATSATIPAFVSGNNIVVAIDSTIAPSGTHLTFSAAVDNEDQQTVGTADLGDNPLVATLDGSSANSLTIIARTPTGHSRTFHSHLPRTGRTPR